MTTGNLTAIDGLVRSISDDAQLERRSETYDNTISLYSTPSYRHRGLVAKTAKVEAGKKLLSKEASSLLSAYTRMTGRNKIPELVVYHDPLQTIVEQRIYGELAIDVVTDPLSLGSVSYQMLSWLRDFHRSDKKTTFTPAELEAYGNFLKIIEQNSSRFTEDSRSRLRELVESLGKQEFSSFVGHLHGDLSPIDFIFGSDGNNYALDFNASREGPIEEDVANFMANSHGHYVYRGQSPEHSSRILTEAATSFFGGSLPYLFQLFLSKAYYQKALLSDDTEMAHASIRLLEADRFRPELLIFS